ncbi:DUF1850 domain-containing protein [Treponema sp. TIM-1]|uniref:DUF1850 domain-containing protein n=1 Tax=Treponema sp. TIM-1 TaxID=2898417 RepID=UPI00397EFF05
MGNLIIALLVVSGAIIFRGLPKKLVITDTESGVLYGRWPVNDGAEFAIEFVHSVNQSPVRDIFQVRGRRIAAVATVFSSFGAGMQTELGAGEELIREEDGTMRIVGFTRSFKSLAYIVGTVSDHTLYINNERISLRERCGKNAHITVRVK